MQRNYEFFLADIKNSIEKINNYLKDLNRTQFEQNLMIQDAVIRNLEIIGEAVTRLPTDLKNNYPNIEWRKIAGLRDILIHAYFGLDLEIIWEIIKNKLPLLNSEVCKILDKE